MKRKRFTKQDDLRARELASKRKSVGLDITSSETREKSRTSEWAKHRCHSNKIWFGYGEGGG